MDVSMDTVSVQIETVVNNSSKAIDTLTQKLGHLRKALESVVKASNGLSNISKSINNINNKTTSSRKQTSNASLKDQLDELKVSFNDKDMISKVRNVDKETIKYKNTLGQIITVHKNMNGELDKYKVTVRETFDKKNGFEKFKNSIAGTVTKIGLLWGTIIKVKNSTKEYVDLSASYVESLNLFFTEMGSKGEEAYEWVQKFSNALYLDPADVMQYMGAFNSLVNGLGVGADRSYIMSKNLTQLTYDLASYKNLDFSTAYEKLMSGISGEIEPLRNTGVALSQATLQELANSMGIKQRINTMNEAQKAELRYIQIIRSSTNWQADLGKTLMSTENILKVASQQWTLFKRALGDVATVIIRYMLPYMIALTQILTESAKALAEFFGFEIDFSQYKTETKNVSSGIKDIGTSADKTTKKLNTMLAPFDKLNVVQNKNESASSGLGGVGSSGGLGVDLPEYDALSKLTGEMSDKIAKAKQQIEGFFSVIKKVGAILLTIWGTSKILKFIGALGSAKTGASTLKAGIGKLAGALGIGAGSMSAILAGIVVSIIALIKETPKLSKAFDDLIIHGKPLDSIAKDFSLIDVALIGVLVGVNHLTGGLLGVVMLTAKAIDIANDKAIKSKDVLKVYDDQISKTSKKKLTPLVKQFENLNKTINTLNFSDKVITKKDISKVKDNLKEISNSIINELDADKNKQLGSLKTIEKALGGEDYSQLLQKTTTYYENQKKLVQTNSDAISNIMKNASDKNRALTQEETNEITRLRNEMYETGVLSATENSDEYYAIMSKLKDNLTALSTEQASDYIKNAKKTKDEAIKNAQEQYDSVVAEAYKMLMAGQINEEEYEKIRNGAKKTKDETVEKAQEQYDEIYKTTTEKLGKTGKYIDEETGEIKSNWQVFTEDVKKKWSEVWTDIKTTASEKWGEVKTWWNKNVAPIFTKKYWTDKFDTVKKEVTSALDELKSKFTNWKATIKTPHFEWTEGGHKASGVVKDVLEALNLPTSIPKLNVKWYEQGGYPDKASLFFANENGIPELVGRIGNQTAVANNDQITTALTSALLTALSGADIGGQGTIVVNIGNKKVYEGMGEQIDSESERYGTSYVNI